MLQGHLDVVRSMVRTPRETPVRSVSEGIPELLRCGVCVSP
jgi:hypothetical protein